MDNQVSDQETIGSKNENSEMTDSQENKTIDAQVNNEMHEKIKELSDDNSALSYQLEESRKKVCELEESLRSHEDNGEVVVLRRKVEKLKKLLLLTDPSVSHIANSVIQNIQWGEYVKAFPEEK